MDLMHILTAAMAGAVCTMTGGMQSFILYGLVVIAEALMSACGADTAAYSEWVMNLFFLPAIMFNASVSATAYAARKHKVYAWEINKGLGFTRDPGVVLVGAGTSVLGYILFTAYSKAGLRLDCGALTVCSVGLISRLIFERPHIVNQKNVTILLDGKNWLFELMVAAFAACSAAIFVQKSGNVSIGFAFSAASLLLQMFDTSFPTTHHITMVAGYAVMATGSILTAVLFGLLAHVIFYIFAALFNSNCGAHIDPPAVAIAICSLIIMNVY